MVSHAHTSVPNLWALGTLPKFMASPARFRYGHSEEIVAFREHNSSPKKSDTCLFVIAPSS